MGGKRHPVIETELSKRLLARMMIRLVNRKLNYLMCIAGFLSACSTINLQTEFERDAAIEAQIVDQTEDLFKEIDPLYINDEIKELLDRLIDAGDSTTVRVAKIQALLYDEKYLNLQYSDTRTHTAVEAFEMRRGNCLSAMNLYVAMARYAGIDAQFQTVEVRPEWDKRGDLLVLSRHINATGNLGYKRKYVVDFTPEIQLQQLTARAVSDLYARALYFNNLGVEALVAEDMDAALTYFKNALYLEPDLSIAWNNIGATYNRMGRRDFAEYSYQMAFLTEDDNATAVNNLAKHYRSAGELELAIRYEEAIQRFNDRNPYYHFARGQLALEAENLEAARSSFQSALRLKRIEPDFYFALADVYTALGDETQAEDLRQSAEEVVAGNAAIYQPSSQKLRVIDSSNMLNDSSAGTTIRFR